MSKGAGNDREENRTYGLSPLTARRIIVMTMVVSRLKSAAVWLCLAALFSGAPGLARAQDAPQPQAEGAPERPNEQPPGTICGSVADRSGALVAGATVKLERDDSSAGSEAVTDTDGRFCLLHVSPGSFHLTVTLPGFTTQTVSGILHSGERYSTPAIVMEIAPASAEVRVTPSQVEIAQEEIKAEEKQRAFGVIPNFYVSYVPNAAPLTPRQKFELAWKTTVDPVTFGLNFGSAALLQATNTPSGYGQGAEGFAKRYGASYADTFAGTFIGSAILPSLLKQDPRYFYKGTGSKSSRVLYALANSVICKGDNGKWQPNYSSIGGSLAAGGLSNLYYSGSDRGVGWTFENALISIGATAATNLLQEFVIKRVTPKLPKHQPVDSVVGRVTSLLIHDGD